MENSPYPMGYAPYPAHQPQMQPGQPMQPMPAPMGYMPQMPGYPPGYPPMYPMYPQPMMPPQQQPQVPMIPLETAIQDFARYKESKGRDKKTITDMELSLHMLPFVRPDIQYVHQITKRLILEYEALVTELPVNYRKNHKLRHLNFQALKAASAGMPRVSPASVDKYVVTLRSFIHWCQDTDRMLNWKLPKFEALDKRNSKDKRHPFTKEELKKLFASPMFNGHQPDRDVQMWRHKPGKLVIKDHHYWMPWIALYSGMRMREIIQLEIKDIRREGNVTYMDVNTDGDGKSLKNHASKRQVPIHPKLVELGFLDYIESLRRQGHKLVFPMAKPTADGLPSNLYTKHFSRYLKATGIKHPKLSFHSFRHTFIDQAARQAKLPDHMIKALVGHADQTITFGTYGGRISIEELAEAQASILYDF